MPDKHIHHGQVSDISYYVDGKRSLKKCRFFTVPINYFSHDICPGRPEDLIRTTDSRRGFEHPLRETELMHPKYGPLGLCSVFRCFLRYIARVARKVNTKLLRCQLQQLQRHTDDEKMLGHAESECGGSCIASFTLRCTKTMDTDACNQQLGYAIAENQTNGTNWPLWYWSYSSISSNRNCSIMRCRCLTLKCATMLLWFF